MHQTIEPSILYFGTPVALITTTNQDGSCNVAPNSAVFWLGWSCMLGIDASSKTTENLLRTKTCVLNLPSFEMAEQVNKLAMFTGSESVPMHKRLLGYRYRKNKLEHTELSTQPAETVQDQAIAECPIQLEARVQQVHSFGAQDPKLGVPAMTFELQIVRVAALPCVLDPQNAHHIDTRQWNPLIMSFRRFFGLTQSPTRSRLNAGSEELYAPWKIPGVLGYVTRIALRLSAKAKLN